MINYTPTTHPLIGNWKSERGFFLEIESVTHHSFKGWFQCLKEGPFYLVRKEIDGLVHLNGDAIIQLVFFCDVNTLYGPAHNYAFSCEVRRLTGKPYMQLYWLGYSGHPQKKTISEGLTVLNRRCRKSDRAFDFSLKILSKYF